MDNVFKLKGTIEWIGDVQVISDKFTKREFAIKISEMVNGKEFQQFIKMQVIKDKCKIMDYFKIGDEVTCTFNIKGNKFEKDFKVSYFTTLECYYIENNSSNVTRQEDPQGHDNIF